ncbi:MAG TPA: phenylalanine--tRNA ligase subunit beta [Blastocatellia bacterium]|nr:phenylalanine--tRNA ligase subunit beta [Blastocatellia bacterium]
MKISYNWIKELVDVDLSPRDLAAKLTMAGLAVDAVEERGPDHSMDNILEFDLTSNRPDCLSHLGVAREAAALSSRPLRTPLIRLSEAKVKTSDVTSVEIFDPDLCPRYTARVIKGVKIGPSPDWLVARLEAMGQRSVNNVADITNYVMLEMGQPLHAFDIHQLRGERIVVRRASNGEKITTLDGEERILTSEMLVIADAERPVALAGVKGGEDSGISETTTDVLLEAAYFAPAQVRATSKALGLSTEASYRFERGTDPEIVATASDRASALIAEIAGGEVLGGLVDVYPRKSARDWIEFRRARYTTLTGLQIELGEAERILRSLGFAVEADVENDRLRALAPSWRIDVSIEEDLIEEVARLAGYDSLKNTLPGSAGAGAYLPAEGGRRATRQVLASLGYNEAVSFSFVNGETDELLSEVGEGSRLALLNPIDETQAHMRVTLLGGLLNALERNFNYGARNVRLFEIGKCFMVMDEEDERPLEMERLGIVATGARNEDDWQASASNGADGGRVDFYDLKGAVESVAEAIGLPALKFTPDDTCGFLHPGRRAEVRLDREVIGIMGQLHPRLAARYKFKQPVFVADLNLRNMLLADQAEVRYHPLPKFPMVVRDLALLIDTAVPFADVELAIKELEVPELVGVKLFDLYAGKELPPGKHSIALSLRYRAADRTLTDEEVNAIHERVIKALKQEFGVEVR